MTIGGINCEEGQKIICKECQWLSRNTAQPRARRKISNVLMVKEKTRNEVLGEPGNMTK